MPTVRVKICGITHAEDALAAAQAGADAIGFMFYPDSPRAITPHAAAAINRTLPPFLTRVGVFVNPTAEQLQATLLACPLDAVQLHGDESPAFCQGLNLKIIKGFRIKDASSLQLLPRFPVDAWLLDAFVPGQRGGTGQSFNWDLACQAKTLGRPIILAGGLHPGNVQAAIRQAQPYAVDVSSGVESAPGRKDPALLQAFLQAAHSA